MTAREDCAFAADLGCIGERWRIRLFDVDHALTQHTNRRYDEQLGQLRETLLAMGELVDAQIRDGVDCFLACDGPRAAEVAARDAQVNRLDTEIDDRCVGILALNQPAAVDLRLIMAALKITTDLERVGDQAASICSRLVEPAHLAALGVDDDLARMARLARAMVRESLDALADLDATRAKAVIVRDDELDALHHALLNRVLAVMIDQPGGIGPGTRVVFVSRSLEQIGDHATNIAEAVVFMVEGRDIRHRERRAR